MVYTYLPFMVLPIYASLDRIDRQLIEAARDLGCRAWQVFGRIIIPLAKPGIIAGCLLVFIPAVGEFVIPDLLGGDDIQMIGKLLWTEFFRNRDWPLASALAMLLLLILIVPMLYLQRLQPRERGAL
jgi:putrescine transport system permease protein